MKTFCIEYYEPQIIGQIKMNKLKVEIFKKKFWCVTPVGNIKGFFFNNINKDAKSKHCD